MKRKTVTAFLMSLCLVLTVPGTAYASEIQSVAEELQVQSVVEENQPDKAIIEDEPDKKEENGQTLKQKARIRRPRPAGHRTNCNRLKTLWQRQ